MSRKQEKSESYMFFSCFGEHYQDRRVDDYKETIEKSSERYFSIRVTFFGGWATDCAVGRTK